jgi:hypothetical protein
MDVDYDFIGRTGATLLGLSFAALAFTYNAYYAPWMPPIFKDRLAGLIFCIIPCIASFGICTLLSSLMIAFTDFENSNTKEGEKIPMLKWPSIICQALHLFGLLMIFWAILALIGVKVLMIPLPQG